MEPTIIKEIVAVLLSIMASSGFWAFVTNWRNKKSCTNRLLIALAHQEIIQLGLVYIDRGSISQEEYEYLNDMLFAAYLEAGGNGMAAKIMSDIQKLPIKQLYNKGEIS